MAKMTIYHNKKCGTSRKVLTYLESKKVPLNVVEYLKTPPTVAEIKTLFKKLDLAPEELIRKKEKIYKTLKLDKKKLSTAEWASIISKNPILIERPIVVKNNKAIIARPPERVKEIA